MTFNPKTLLQLKDRLKLFRQDHPKLKKFGAAVIPLIEQGTVVEVSVTGTDGTKKAANIRLTANDIETINMALSMRN